LCRRTGRRPILIGNRTERARIEPAGHLQRSQAAADQQPRKLPAAGAVEARRNCSRLGQKVRIKFRSRPQRRRKNSGTRRISAPRAGGCDLSAEQRNTAWRHRCRMSVAPRLQPPPRPARWRQARDQRRVQRGETILCISRSALTPHGRHVFVVRPKLGEGPPRHGPMIARHKSHHRPRERRPRTGISPPASPP